MQPALEAVLAQSTSKQRKHHFIFKVVPTLTLPSVNQPVHTQGVFHQLTLTKQLMYFVLIIAP